MKAKRLLALGLSVIVMLSAASCSKSKVMDKDGNILEYTESEVIKKSGFFVHVTKSETEAVYEPLLKPSTVGYQSFDTGSVFDFSSDSARFIMIANHDNLIPIITGNNFLVFVETDDLLPAIFRFEKMEDKGYTLGALFETKESETGIFIQNMSGNVNSLYYVDDSDFKKQWEKKKNIKTYSIDTIGGAGVGERNIDTNGAFKGLEKDSNYEMAAFIGTQFETVVVKADTHYLVAGDITTVSQRDCVQRTTNGYAIVKIPSNLTSGYYLINDEYLFFYDKDNSKSPTTDQFVLDIPGVDEVDDSGETTESSYYEVTFQNGDLDEDYEDPGDIEVTETEKIEEATAPTEQETEDTASETSIEA